MNDITLREWGKLEYQDPEFILSELRKLEIEYAQLPIDKRTLNLRTNKLKKYREGREAALFCFGIGKYMGKKVFFSPTEASDYNFVVLWKDGEFANYAPVQIKEFVPADLNPALELDDLISGLKKYQDSSKLIVAIHLNRRIHLEFNNLNIPRLKLAGLFLFGAVSEDQEKWMLQGDLLDNPQTTTFDYPYLGEEQIRELPQEKENETTRPLNGEHKMGSLEIIVLVVIFALIAWGTYELGFWLVGQFSSGTSQ